MSSKAVDGKTKTNYFQGLSCTHTSESSAGWWCINLQQIYNIINITIYNRATEQHRLKGFELKISSSDQCNGAGFMSATPCYKDTSQEILPVYNITECNQPSSTSLSAKTFFINVTDVLTLCEVQIYTGICSDGYYNVSNSRCKACNTCVGNECNPESGICNDGCKDGYKDSRCTTACPTNCVRCNDSSCSVCKPGWYGTNCQQRCNEGCLNTTCTKSNGSCSICKSGWYATNCQERCSEGCLNITCSKSDGSCSVCKPGWYGTNCDSVCSGNCNDGCNKSNGICNECKQGYVGLFCGIECGAICQPIMNGAKELNECDVDQDCSKNCTEICVDEICNHKSLNCSYGCIGGKKGHSCSKPLVSDNIPTANDNTAIIATVVSVLLLILICCLVVFLVFKHKR
ncbi:multiple epidermal growth factor-like domains protein 10 [Patella vulgata]|uniref:multiple epidermal growth factor-like domains protein 10 n=1 Tax=Patella vulgata TaxID=6465 RepID=UPI00218047CF|nr:multiple epidermal growth factor-like domains protein 10 [Patella vulgata]